MITIRAQNNYNERFAPQGAKKAYVARITGRDPKYTFKKEFLAGKDSYDVDEPGLYEVRNVDKKGRPDDEWVIVLMVGEKLEEFSADKSEAMAIAKALEQRDIDAIAEPNMENSGWHLITAKQAEKAAIAHSIDSATRDCWAILSAFPEKEAKKVLWALKVLVSPPKKAVGIEVRDETPVGVVRDMCEEAGADMSVNGGLTPIAKEQEAKS
jgi:hypothetical protein